LPLATAMTVAPGFSTVSAVMPLLPCHVGVARDPRGERGAWCRFQMFGHVLYGAPDTNRQTTIAQRAEQRRDRARFVELRE